MGDIRKTTALTNWNEISEFFRDFPEGWSSAHLVGGYLQGTSTGIRWFTGHAWNPGDGRQLGVYKESGAKEVAIMVTKDDGSQVGFFWRDAGSQQGYWAGIPKNNKWSIGSADGTTLYEQSTTAHLGYQTTKPFTLTESIQPTYPALREFAKKLTGGKETGWQPVSSIPDGLLIIINGKSYTKSQSGSNGNSAQGVHVPSGGNDMVVIGLHDVAANKDVLLGSTNTGGNNWGWFPSTNGQVYFVDSNTYNGTPVSISSPFGGGTKKIKTINYNGKTIKLRSNDLSSVTHTTDLSDRYLKMNNISYGDRNAYASGNVTNYEGDGVVVNNYKDGAGKITFNHVSWKKGTNNGGNAVIWTQNFENLIEYGKYHFWIICKTGSPASINQYATNDGSKRYYAIYRVEFTPVDPTRTDKEWYKHWKATILKQDGAAGWTNVIADNSQLNQNQWISIGDSQKDGNFYGDFSVYWDTQSANKPFRISVNAINYGSNAAAIWIDNGVSYEWVDK